MKKKFFAVAVSVFALALAVSVSASMMVSDFGSSTLKVGSSGQSVMNLQTQLNTCDAAGLTVDGAFGPGTNAAVEAFQTKEGLTVDGAVGPNTKAALASCTSSVTTTTTTTTTGTTALCPNGMTLASNCMTSPAASAALCPNGMTLASNCMSAATVSVLPAGCSSSAGYSSTTGQACSTTPTVNPTAAGSISTDGILGGFNNTVVGTGDVNHQVVGFQLTGAGGGSNLNLTSATVQFTENPASSGSYTGSSRFADYFSAVSIWENGIQVGSVPASQFTSNSVTGIPNYVYSASIPLSGATVTAGQNSNFYVAVTANTTIDTGNFSAGNLWMVQVNNIRSVDGTGTTLVYTPSNSFPTTWTSDPTFSFGSTASANNIVLNVERASTDLNAHVVTVNATGGTTSKVPLLQLAVSSQGGQAISINKLPVTFTSSVNVGEVTNYVYLMEGSAVLDSETITSGQTSPDTVVFKVNPSSPLIITPGQTVDLTIAADVNSVAGGGYAQNSWLAASTPIGSTSYDLTSGNPNGTELVTSSNATTLIPGSAIGQEVAFASTGINVAVQSDNCSANNPTYSGGAGSVTCTIGFTIAANNAPAYIPQTATTASTSASSLDFWMVNASAPNTAITSNTTAVFSQNGTIATQNGSTDWIIPAGNTATFTATVTYSSGSPTAGNYRGFLNSVPWGVSTGSYPNLYNFNLGSTASNLPGYVYLQ